MSCLIAAALVQSAMRLAFLLCPAQMAGMNGGIFGPCWRKLATRNFASEAHFDGDTQDPRAKARWTERMRLLKSVVEDVNNVKAATRKWKMKQNVGVFLADVLSFSQAQMVLSAPFVPGDSLTASVSMSIFFGSARRSVSF